MEPLAYITSRIKELNPKHATKILRNISVLDEEYKEHANSFYVLY